MNSPSIHEDEGLIKMHFIISFIKIYVFIRFASRTLYSIAVIYDMF